MLLTSIDFVKQNRWLRSAPNTSNKQSTTFQVAFCFVFLEAVFHFYFLHFFCVGTFYAWIMFTRIYSTLYIWSCKWKKKSWILKGSSARAGCLAVKHIYSTVWVGTASDGPLPLGTEPQHPKRMSISCWGEATPPSGVGRQKWVEGGNGLDLMWGTDQGPILPFLSPEKPALLPGSVTCFWQWHRIRFGQWSPAPTGAGPAPAVPIHTVL